jgi:hypothetical protein
MYDGSVCCADTGLTSVRVFAVNSFSAIGYDEQALHDICSAAGSLE